MDNFIGFKCVDLVNCFKELKKNSITKWWNNYLYFDFQNIKTSPNKIKWITIKCRTDINNNYQKLSIIIKNEVHCGQIMPTKVEDVAELKAKFPDSKIDVRQYKACLHFQKWSTKVPTQEDKVSLITVNDTPVLPTDEYLSNYFQLIEFINEVFLEEVKERIQRFDKIKYQFSESNDYSVTNFIKICKENKHIVNNDTIVVEHSYRNGIKNISNEINLFMLNNFLIVQNDKCNSIIQEFISDNSPINPGKKLPNPGTRITLPFDLKGNQNVSIYDKSKPIVTNNKKHYEEATVDGNVIDADNVHKFITPRSVIDGIISLDSVCISKLGLSISAKAGTVIVKQVNKKFNNIEKICMSIYDSDNDDDKDEEKNNIITNIENIINE